MSRRRGHDRHRPHRGDRVHEDLRLAWSRSPPTARWSAPTATIRSTTKDGKWHAVAAEIEERHEEGRPSSSAPSPSRSPSCSRSGSSARASRTRCSTPSPSTPSARARSGRGRPARRVAIATNMAGRGIDIKLGGNAEHLTDLELAKLGLRRAIPTTTSASPRSCRHRDARAGGPREGRDAAGCSSSAPSATSRGASTTSRAGAPAARAIPAGALLPLRRGRPRAPVRRRPHYRILDGLGSTDEAATRSPSRRGCSPSSREGPAQGRGAELPHPRARARVRRRHERAAAHRLEYRDQVLEGRDMGRQARAEIVGVVERLVDEYAPPTTSRTGTWTGCSSRSRTSTRSASTPRRSRARTSAARSSPNACRATP